MSDIVESLREMYRQINNILGRSRVDGIIISRDLYDALNDKIFESLKANGGFEFYLDGDLGEFARNRTLFGLPLFPTDAPIGAIFLVDGNNKFTVSVELERLLTYRRSSNPDTWGPTVGWKNTVIEENIRIEKENAETLEDYIRKYGVEYKEEEPTPKKETPTNINNRKLRP